MPIESDILVTIILPMVVIVLVLQEGLQANDIFGCSPTQLLELGNQGYIKCTFPTGLSEVYWYDNASGSSDLPPFAVLRLDSNEKTGLGIESGECDILPNGTLVLNNVTLVHEKQYQVLGCTQKCNFLSTVSVKVIAHPGSRSPSIESCNAERACIISFTIRGSMICQFDSARPPVDLEWVEQTGKKDSQIEGQRSFSVLNDDGVTFRSYAILNKTVFNDRYLAVFGCKPKWNYSSAVTVTKQIVLVDYTDEFDYLSLSKEDTIYYEINRRAELRCEGSNSAQILWKRIDLKGNKETVAFQYENTTHNNAQSAGDVYLSREGNLIFTALQLYHEGSYICIYDSGKGVRGIRRKALRVLVPPSPPYVQIEACKENPRCQLNGNRSGWLTCSIHAVRPEVSLTWLNLDEGFVLLRHQKAKTTQRDQPTDVSKSVYYEIANDVACGSTFGLKCEVGHPISRIIQPFAQIFISSDECTGNNMLEDQGRQMSPAVIIIVSVLACILGIVGLVTYLHISGKCKVGDLMKFFKTNGQRRENRTCVCEEHENMTSSFINDHNEIASNR